MLAISLISPAIQSKPGEGTGALRPADIISKYAGVEIAVRIRHREKHAGDIGATFSMEYPSIELALESIAGDLLGGRVECITAGGEVLTEQEVEALTRGLPDPSATIGST